MNPFTWTSSGKEVIPGLAGRKLITGAHYFGNGAFEYSMLAKFSRSNGRVYAHVPLDLKSNGCTEEDIVVMEMTCPDNFGTGNPYYLVEFLKYVATMAPVRLSNVYLACIRTQQEDGRVVNGLNVFCAEDIVQCLCGGIWPEDNNEYAHQMRFLYRIAYGILYRRVTGNHLTRDYTSDGHHVVAYQNEFQVAAVQSSQQSSQRAVQSSQQSSQCAAQSSQQYRCDVPVCGAVFASAGEYTAHMLQRQQKVEKPFRCMEKNCDKAYAEKWHLTRHWDEKHNPERKKFTCETCQQTFVRQSTYQAHVARQSCSTNRCNCQHQFVAFHWQHIFFTRSKRLSFQAQSTPSWQLVQSKTPFSKLLISCKLRL
ncbi:hypothetical protein MP228_002827 [Amoeboaphelidium protococcarum]|nr:hypothetical protein MP228_002827 [Amoeboaphelidium protococcarum]